MELREALVEKLKQYGVGRRKLDDELFVTDKPPPRLGIYDEDDENLCHEVVKSTCNIPGCKFTTESLLEFENHYNASHRYTCSQCKKVLPSPHLLDLHIQENHDSFFAVLAAKKPSYCCYIEECKEKFMDADERRDHCVKVHRLPKDFRFDQKPKSAKPKRPNHKKKTDKDKTETSMEVDKNQTFSFNNSKQKAFVKYTGKKFTKVSKSASQDVNMDDAMEDLRKTLPD
ncbi:zinc finger protein 511 isoform X2 [Pectinophora gossypiella]|nr:zinc finger protein 511 isoform X2 [Pectinophora gossypiella]XP_049878992.1 zinc finger protein 511 isoform X2 [Pectinophora gossypiella]